jgi:hypothetical protein
MARIFKSAAGREFPELRGREIVDAIGTVALQE